MRNAPEGLARYLMLKYNGGVYDRKFVIAYYYDIRFH